MKNNIELKYLLNKAIDSGDFEKADNIVKSLNTETEVKKSKKFNLKGVFAVAAAIMIVTVAAVSISAAMRNSLIQSGISTKPDSSSYTVKEYLNVSNVTGNMGDFKITVNDYLKNDVTNTGIISITIENTAKDNRFFYAVMDVSSKEDDEILNTKLKSGINGRPVVFQSREYRSEVFPSFDPFVSDRIYFVEEGSDANTLNAVIFFSAGDMPLERLYLNNSDMSEKLVLQINAQKSLPTLSLNSDGFNNYITSKTGENCLSEITLSSMDISIPETEQEGIPSCKYLSLIMKDGSERIIKSPDEKADVYALFGSMESDGKSIYIFNRFVDIENVSAIKYNDFVIEVDTIK